MANPDDKSAETDESMMFPGGMTPAPDEDNAVVFKLNGIIKRCSSPGSCASTIERMLKNSAGGASKVLFDCKDVDRWDSSFTGVLVCASRINGGTKVELRDPPDIIKEMIKITKLDGMLKLTTSKPDAGAACETLP